MRRLLSILLLLPSLAFGATTNRIISFGVTFEFDSAVEYGTFAGGIWQGVVGPVTITNIIPAWDGTNNGFQVNVPFSGDQAFSAYPGVGGFTNSVLPSLPLTISTNACVVKAIAKTNDALPAVQAYGVLTVLTAAPPAGWADTIRPSIAGTTNRPLYTIADIRTNLLPTLDRSVMTNYTTLATTVTDFSKGAMVDFHAWDARRFRDAFSLYDYQPENGPLYMNSMLSLFFNDSFATKSNALVIYLTIALDRMTLVHQGYQQPGTGHNPGHRTIAAFAAVLLNVTNVIAYMSTNVGFHEDEYLYYSPTAGQVLWGQTDSTESGYWNWIMSSSGSRSHRDPYGYIDGGDYDFLAGEYQIITSQFIKGAALAGRLMTNIQSCFPSNSWWVMNTYAERWVTNGGWMTPDPVARYDGIPGNYGITFGPDGMGSYIAGSGRTNQNYTADGGQYRSLFVANLWQNYGTNDSGGGGGGGGFGRAFSSQIGGWGVTFGGKGAQIR